MVGKTVSHYEILRKLGEGGMGAVYEASDRRLHRRVALKFLSPSLVASAEARARFEREAQAVSSLSHPNIGVLFSFEDAGDGPFLVLEYLPGGTLHRRLSDLNRAGRLLPVNTAVRWAAEIAGGIAHAHRKGVVHRDIKPGNVMFDEEDRLKITDFGLAKLCEGIDITGTGAMMGTPAYMSPEQALGCGGVDQRADIFSLGVLLYEMVSGRLPFQADTQLGTLHKILHDEPDSPRQLRREAPEELDRIIRKCLAKAPEDRYQRMEEVAGALEILGGAHPTAPPSPLTMTFAEAETVLSEPEASAVAPAAAEATAPAPEPSRPRRISRVWTSRGLLLRAAIVVAACAVLLIALFPRIAASEQRKIAVLLFENIGGGEAQQAFCDGLTYSLTSTITQFEKIDDSIWIVPASEIQSEDIHSARAARKAFGVNLAITGSVRRSPDRVRVTVNLVDATESRQLESRSLQAPLAELASLENRLLEAVGEMLEVDPAAAGTAPGAGTRIAPAYDDYLRGRGYLQRFDKPGNLDLAVKAFQAALDEDPNYALALAGLGEANIARHTLTREPRWLLEARTENRRAIALDETLAPAHVNLCILYTRTGRYEEAIREGKRTLELDPLGADGYRALANAYAAAGRLAEAESTYRQAIDLRPESWLAHKDLGVFYTNHDRFEEAVPLFQKVIELVPDNEWGYRNLAAVYQISGRYEEARTLLEKAVAVQPNGNNLSNLGTLDFSMGRFEEAVRSYERAVDLSPEDPIIRGNLADAYRAVPALRSKAPETYRQALAIAKRQLAINRKDSALLLGLAVYSARLGQKKEALSYLAQTRALMEPNLQLSYQSAIIYELTGQRDQALNALSEAIRAGYPAREAKREPEFAGLRQDPRFDDLITE